MPTFMFYADRDDATAILRMAFEELGCRVFEAYSNPDSTLRTLSDVNDVLSAYPEAGPNRRFIHVALWTPALGPEPTVRRIAFKPGAVPGHTYRHTLEGWGLVHLAVAIVRDEETLGPSDVKHHSEAGARKWEDTLRHRLGPIGAWDWRAVTHLARALGTRIRRDAVGKIGTRPVLPGAQRLAASGRTLALY